MQDEVKNDKTPQLERWDRTRLCHERTSDLTRLLLCCCVQFASWLSDHTTVESPPWTYGSNGITMVIFQIEQTRQKLSMARKWYRFRVCSILEKSISPKSSKLEKSMQYQVWDTVQTVSEVEHWHLFRPVLSYVLSIFTKLLVDFHTKTVIHTQAACKLIAKRAIQTSLVHPLFLIIIAFVHSPPE